MSSRIARIRLRTISCIRALASGRKIFLDVLLAQRLAQIAVGLFGAALPARLHLARAAQVFSEELKVFALNRRRQRFRR